ncbi:Entericidin EcnAB [Roseovarius nitratireducens]|uniref:Entericidin EcnAB n=1 Tax=Roseovarius nitratireducens TaxID=2044597 RepID=UPI000CE23982|nr:Entericidin EcnAB [Roseovarius nitratireducens]
MKTSWFTTAPLLTLAIVAALLLQGCSTTAGIGRDVSAGADAITESAEANKTY